MTGNIQNLQETTAVTLFSAFYDSLYSMQGEGAARINASARASVKQDGKTKKHVTFTLPHEAQEKNSNQRGMLQRVVKASVGVILGAGAIFYVNKNVKNGNIKTTTPYRFLTDLAIQVAADSKAVKDAGMHFVKTIGDQLPGLMYVASSLGQRAAQVAEVYFIPEMKRVSVI